MTNSHSALLLTQDELKYLLAISNMALQTGKLQTGDILILAPALDKIRSLVKQEPKIEEPKIEETKPEVPEVGKVINN